MYRDNESLQRAVLDEFRWDSAVHSSAIGVAVSEGVVSLFGEVATVADKAAAVRAAERVPGVRAVAEAIVVRTPGTLRWTDADIAREASQMLAANEAVPDSVKCRVEGGYLWLEGEADWEYQRIAAEELIFENEARLIGLRGITNDIVVARPATLPAILYPRRAHDPRVLSA